MTMTLFEFFLLIGTVVITTTGLYVLIFVQQMSDEDREKMGHGPKGQGR